MDWGGLLGRLMYGWFNFVVAPAQWWTQFWAWACGVDFRVEDHNDHDE